MKCTLSAATCMVLLVAGLTACGGQESKAARPTYTGAPSPSATATTSPPTTAAPTQDGPVAPVAHSTYTYGGLTLVVNLPADISTASQPSMRVFSEFLQADGRSTALNKIDPAISRLASADVLKDMQDSVTSTLVEGIGSLSYTVSKVQTGTSGFSIITGCVDQSKVVQARKDGSHFLDPSAKKHPTLKMSADVSPGLRGRQVTSFRFALGSC